MIINRVIEWDGILTAGNFVGGWFCLDTDQNDDEFLGFFLFMSYAAEKLFVTTNEPFFAKAHQLNWNDMLGIRKSIFNLLPHPGPEKAKSLLNMFKNTFELWKWSELMSSFLTIYNGSQLKINFSKKKYPGFYYFNFSILYTFLCNDV